MNTKSYSGAKRRRLDDEMSGENSPKTLTEITTYIRAGLKHARDLLTDDSLLAMLDLLEDTWEKVSRDFLIISRGIGGMNSRTKEDIEAKLTEARGKLKTATGAAEIYKPSEFH
jgi:hypothetical protein